MPVTYHWRTIKTKVSSSINTINTIKNR